MVLWNVRLSAMFEKGSRVITRDLFWYLYLTPQSAFPAYYTAGLIQGVSVFSHSEVQEQPRQAT